MKWLVIAFLVLFSQEIKAQTWAEWVQQKKTQRKYLVQQIAALQVYLNYAKQGYAIAQAGLGLIGKIKKGDFDLHDGFFTSLKNVNPSIATSAKVAAIIERGLQIVREVQRIKGSIAASNAFGPEEIMQHRELFHGIINACLQTIEELSRVLLSRHYEMSDDERMQRIGVLYDEMEAHYSFCVSEVMEMGLLNAQRISDQIEVDYSRKLNGRQ